MKKIDLTHYHYSICRIGLISLISLVSLLLPSSISAANLTDAYLRLDRMTNGVPTGGKVCVMMATTANADSFIEVTFPAGFSLDGTVGNWTTTVTNLGIGASAMPGIGSVGVGGISGQIARWPISDITDTSLNCFNFSGTTTLTTGGGTGSDKQGSIRVYYGGSTTVGTSTINDQANYAVALIANDQAVVTATVPPTFTFVLGNLSQSLGTLSSSAVTPSNPGITVYTSTNANNGWIAWVKSLNQALNSTTTGDTIPTIAAAGMGVNETVNAGANGYVLDSNITIDSASGATGVVSIPPEYADGDNTGLVTLNHGGSLFANFSEVATANGPTDGDTITLIARVAISGLTKAAEDYTDTLTIVGAGNF